MTKDIELEMSLKKVARLNEHLEKRFGFKLASESYDYLHMVGEHYRSKREFILNHYGLAESLEREDYAKAVMISEAIAMILREIAPKRMRKRSKRKDAK